MKKYILNIIAATALLFASSGNIAAQSSITGIVKEGLEGYPLVGITVTILETSTSTTTGSLGEYTLGAATGQIRTIVVSGYPSSARTIVVASGTNIINFWVDAATDYDGNKYGAVEIGSQIWMDKNLKVTYFRDGTSIPNVTDNSEWGSNNPYSRYCWYNNDALTYKDTYGGLYNYFAVSTGNLCPQGWHVPTNDEWHTLALFLDASAVLTGLESSIAGGKLKEAGTTHWLSPNEASNESGFTALPGGMRIDNGEFVQVGFSGYWWSSSGTFYFETEIIIGGEGRSINHNDTYLWRGTHDPVEGLSVRCLKGATLPIINTASVSDITYQSAVSGGNLTSDGGAEVIESGICWNTSGSPAISDNHTSDGTGTGSFTSLMTGLEPNTTYYVRAYATNIAGTAYGPELSFNTCPAAPTLGTITQPTCAVATGSVVLTDLPIRGMFQWTITIFPGGTTITGFGNSTTITDLANGTYNFTVSIVGCTSPASANVVIDPQPTTPTAPVVGTISQPTCTLATGSVDLNDLPASGTWALTRTPGETTTTGTGTNTTIVGLPAGNYTYTVTNSAGCTSTSSSVVTINAQPVTPTAPVVGTITQPTCYNTTGSVILNGLPSIGEWILTRYPGAVATPGSGTSITLSGLAGGTYNYAVTNAEGCTSSLSSDVIINVPLVLNATLDYTNVLCNSANNGEIWISSPSGGSGSYEYTINGGSSWQTETIYSGLTPGTYNVQIRDASSPTCIVVLNNNLVITEPEVLNATVTSSDVTCYGSGDGTITIANPTGGSGIYQFTYSGSEGWSESGTFTNVSPGIYDVEIRDADVEGYCIVTLVEGLEIGEPDALSVSASTTNVLCFGGSNGSIDLTVTGGTAPYAFLWNNGAATEDLTGLTAGNYNVTVTDVNGCTANSVVIVTQPQAPLEATVVVQNVLCYEGNMGEIRMTVTGGTPTYTYIWNTGSTSEDLSDLVAGTYSVTITDNNGCSIVYTATVTEPDILNATVTSSDITCYDSSDGTITLSNPTGGTGGVTGYEWAYEYSINEGESWISPGSFTNLGAGFYNVRIRDTEITACIITLATDLEITEPVILSATVSSTNVTCYGGNDGSITISDPQGGHGAYEYSIDAEAGWYGSGTFTGLTVGTYNVRIRDAEFPLCEINLQAGLAITQPDEINVVETIANVSCNSCKDGAIDISVTGGTGGYIYAWTGPDGYTSTSEDLSNLFMGTYNLLITDANSCVRSFAYDVLNPSEVTNITDNGYGSLRYALDYANSTLDVKETITFNIPGTGPFTIKPETELPSITDPVVIDGYSQPGTSADNSMLLIEIDGSDAGEGSGGLTISGGRSTVKGLIINRFNGSGVVITTSGENLITGNYIGVDYTGTKPMGNGGSGIQIMNLSSGNILGGTGSGEKNVISGNGSSGISIGTYGSGNTISSNSIYNNGGFGIDLGDDGITANDNGDTDMGPNTLQNYPVLTSLSFSQGTVTISGSLNSTADTEYLLQFFANKLGDDSMYGEGQKYIGSSNVLTDAYGNATFSETFTVYSSWGDTFTATATDPGGSTSEFSKAIGGLKEQVVAAADWPLHYSINKDGLLKVPETSTVDIDAINAAFKTWTDITTSTVEFISDGTTDLKYAGIDNVNLVSFVDDQFDFGTGVLAVAAKTTEVDENDVQIRIIDSDIIFNPYWVNNLEYNFGVGNDGPYGGYFDIQSVATHEIGHILGLIHSGIPGSTMFFMLGTGTFVRTLANDDIAWASYRYPESNYTSTFGSISGTITYGYSPENDPQPVAGALIKAVNTDPNIKYSVHSYSDADGTYQVPGLIPGTYEVFIEPLDGDVQGFSLKPQNISSYLFDHTVYIDYPGEFYNVNDVAVEADDYKTSFTVLAGIPTTGKDLITNKDFISPYVVAVSPGDTILDFDIVKDITVKFSEAIELNTLTDETIYLEYTEGAETKKHFGTITAIGNGTNIILFNPESVLRYSTDYTFYVTDGVKDLKENSLVPFTSTFTTMDADSEAPEIVYVIPADGADSVFVTEDIRLSFSEPMDKSTVEAAFALTWNEGTPAVFHEVEGSYQWDSKSMIMTYAPLRSLLEATVYTVTVSETAKDLGGNYLDATESFTFETVPSSPPQIIYLGPANTATGVTVETPVVVDFSEPVNPETVSLATFRLAPTGGMQVSGTFEFLNDNSRIVFRPDANLSFNTSYTIELATGIEDLSQPAVGMEITSNTIFTTASQITTPHLQYLEPSAGITGSVVLISGFGFDPDPARNRVTFNGIQTSVRDATLTELITVVPNGVMSGPVTVTVNNVVSDNTMHFDIIPESLNPCSDVVANTSTGTQITHDVDIRGDCAYAYVTNPDDNTISVVDLDPDNPGVVAIVDVGTTPMKIDIDPQGTKAYVTNYNSHNVSVLDISNENGALAEVVNTIKVGIEPYGIAVTPDGKRVYVANHYSENLSIIDVDPTSGGFDHVVANVTTGSGTTSVAISGECALAVVTGDFGVKIVNADPEDPGYNNVIATVSSGTKTKEIDISGEAGLAIVTTEDGNLLVINLYPEGGDYSDAVVANVPTGTQVSDVKISGDCMFVYVTDTQNGNVLVYKFTQTGSGIPDGSYIAGLTLELHNTIEVGTSPIGLAIDDKAERLFITDGDNLGRRVTEIRICCGPITPTNELAELIMIIQNLITYGEINVSEGNSLIKKCNDALANIYAGKPKTAINNLNAFINKVKEYIAGGIISRDQGDELIARAKAIIAMLKLTKSAETGLLLNDFDKFAYEEDLVSESGLGVIYPNPFSESIVINYEVGEGDPGTAKVLIRIFDMSGRLIETLVDKNMQPGYYTVLWDSKNNNDEQVPAGTYIVHFRAGIAEEVREIILIR